MKPISFNELKTEYHNQSSCDDWAQAMSAWFDIAEELYLRGVEVPAAWEFTPSPLLKERDKDSWFANEVIQYADTDALVRFGNLMLRYTRILQKAGKDY